MGVRAINISEVKNSIYEVVKEYFKNANVVWAEQIQTRPQLPYIVLKTRDLQKDSFASVDKEGRYYNATLPIEINLYTKGRKATDNPIALNNYMNTATSDLMDFCNYLESEMGIDKAHGLTFLDEGPVRDLSELQNEKYRYRAMVEMQVYFKLSADGAYGVKGSSNSSGGDLEMESTASFNIEYVDLEGGIE